MIVLLNKSLNKKLCEYEAIIEQLHSEKKLPDFKVDFYLFSLIFGSFIESFFTNGLIYFNMSYKNVLGVLKGWIQVWGSFLFGSIVFLFFGKLFFVKYHYTIYIKNQRIEIFKMVPIPLISAKNYWWLKEALIMVCIN